MLKKVLREHRALLAIVLVHAVVASLVLALVSGRRWVSVVIYQDIVPWLLLAYAAAFLFGYFWWVVIVARPPQLRQYLRDHLVARFVSPSQLLGGVLVVAAVSVALSVYTSVKSAIPQIVPFTWDEAFMRADRLLHGGRHPWEWMQPLLGSPAATEFLDTTYHLWFVLVYVGLFWQAFSRRDPVLRQQFLLSFVLVWALVGNLLATLLSSAGPCYFRLVSGQSDPYAPLLQYLAAIHGDGHRLQALTLQAGLWQSHRTGGVGFGSGISAMPSVHNAMVWLLVFVCWRTHRALGIALAAFAALIFIGSVHLAWHYAVDTYVAILLTALIWTLVGRWVRDRCS